MAKVEVEDDIKEKLDEYAEENGINKKSFVSAAIDVRLSLRGVPTSTEE